MSCDHVMNNEMNYIRIIKKTQIYIYTLSYCFTYLCKQRNNYTKIYLQCFVPEQLLEMLYEMYCVKYLMSFAYQLHIMTRITELLGK